MKRPLVIVGGGVFGLCTLLALARKGVDCLLLEAGELASGASGRSGGMIRLWHADPRMRELARAGQRFWKARPGYHATGSLYFELPGERPEPLPGTEWVTAQEGRRRFPEFVWEDGRGAVYEAEAGWVEAEPACLSLAAEARSLGAEIQTGVRVEKIEGKTLHTTAGVVQAEAVVWAGGAFETLDGTVFPASERRYIQVLELEGSFPELPCFLDRGSLGFGRAIHGGALWIGVGLKTPAESAEPVALDLEDAARAREVVSRRLPLADRDFVSGVRLPDRYRADRFPLFGKAEQEGLYWAWCGSGGGFKVAPALADRLVEEMLCLSP